MKTTRFGVSLPTELIQKFDQHIQLKGYENRSEAIRDLIRSNLVEKQIDDNKQVIGVLNFIYDHHRREVGDRLTHIQHDYTDLIISSMHIHLDHFYCLEVVLLRGESRRVKELSDKLLAQKGVMHGNLSLNMVGKGVI